MKHYRHDEISNKLVYIDWSYFRMFEQCEITCYNSLKTSLKLYADEYHYYFGEDSNNLHLIDKSKNENPIKLFYFKNNFLFNLNRSLNNLSWVDIEKEYYIELKECAQNDNKSQLKKLNKEFEQVKQLFQKYLEKSINSFELASINNEEKDCFSKYFQFKKESIDEYKKEFPFKDDKEHIKNIHNEFIQISKNTKSSSLIRNFFVNFNYTSSLDYLIKLLQDLYSEGQEYYGMSISINIHGKLNDSNNPINFGYGNENDSDYALIEDLEDNEYLEYFKSFQYLQNDNYHNLLRFMELEKFQVFIWGHSCGLSDRTLLSTIFEHDNCRSIKIFYHQRKDGSDNYTEIVQNISRHFSDKKMMRAKLVNKELCERLPQDMRFVKKQTPTN